jgi:hypothetical protein
MGSDSTSEIVIRKGEPHQIIFQPNPFNQIRRETEIWIMK